MTFDFSFLEFLEMLYGKGSVEKISDTEIKESLFAYDVTIKVSKALGFFEEAVN